MDPVQADDSSQDQAEAMIAHVVLFAPSPTLTPADRDRFIAVVREAFSSIPGIARARVGRRTLLGRPYDALVRVPVEYAAILEFDTEADLRRYLEHPAHAELGRRFGAMTGMPTVCDFEMVEPDRLMDLVDSVPAGGSAAD